MILQFMILERNLQNSLLLLNKWCRENGMIINTDKTKVMLIKSRQKRYNLKNTDLSLNFKGADLKLTSNEKVLGVHIDDNLLWNGHFQYISKKTSFHLWLPSQIKSFLSNEDKMLFYNAYIRPHIDCCSVIWGNSTNFNIEKMTKIQRRACKIILGSKYPHLEDAHNHLKILSFDESVFLNKAKMYKIANNIAPSYLIDLFQMRKISDDITSSLRSVAKKKNSWYPSQKLIYLSTVYHIQELLFGIAFHWK